MLIQYGEKKRGSAKLHSHNKCYICSEKNISKKTVRQDAKKDMEEQVIQEEDRMRELINKTFEAFEWLNNMGELKKC